MENRRGYTLYKENPFLVDSAHLTDKKDFRKHTTEKVETIVGIGGQVASQVITKDTFEVYRLRKVDTAQFLKFYTRGIAAMSRLKPPGLRVFEALCWILREPGNIEKDLIYMSFTILNPETSMSRSTYSKGLKELKEANFVANSTEPNWFWINPEYVWNGRRLVTGDIIDLDETQGQQKQPTLGLTEPEA